jgi:hypothetical protein
MGNPIPRPLRGGPRISRTWLDADSPSRPTAWRHIRGLRHQPPGAARKRNQRRDVFCAALEQAEQLFTAAEAVSDAARPILLFYGLNQAGRAIAAASTDVDGNHYRLSGHGIAVTNLDQRPPLHELIVADKDDGSFTQLAPLLRSGTLPNGATLGEIWVSIPSLLGHWVGDTAPYLPPLRFEPFRFMGLYGDRQELVAWIHGLPANLLLADNGTEAVEGFLARYPSLAGSVRSHLIPDELPADNCHAGTRKALRAWSCFTPPEAAGVPKFLTDDAESRTLPYLGDGDRWVFPSLGGADIPLHPLLAWWALLYTLSMLARYEPASWTSSLDVDERGTAVTLQAALSLALDICPQLILHAIRAVGGL